MTAPTDRPTLAEETTAVLRHVADAELENGALRASLNARECRALLTERDALREQVKALRAALACAGTDLFAAATVLDRHARALQVESPAHEATLAKEAHNAARAALSATDQEVNP